MTGASIEKTLELRASSLRGVKARMRVLFTQERVAASANLFLDGLLGAQRNRRRDGNTLIARHRQRYARRRHGDAY